MDINFKLVSSIQPVSQYLATTIANELKAEKRVLWLAPGGSGIEVAVAAFKLMAQDNVPMESLSISLTDERYGPVGHPDSNALQFAQAGLDIAIPIFEPVLRDQDMQTTTQLYADWLKRELGIADYSIGFFGIGPDGHTAGILPNSPAVRGGDYAVGYDAVAFKRITITPPAISQLNEAVVYAVGKAKHPVIKSLSNEVSLNEQPAQALKQVPKLTIFSDYAGDTDKLRDTL